VCSEALKVSLNGTELATLTFFLLPTLSLPYTPGTRFAFGSELRGLLDNNLFNNLGKVVNSSSE
jgi:hypothetical protein